MNRRIEEIKRRWDFPVEEWSDSRDFEDFQTLLRIADAASEAAKAWNARAEPRCEDCKFLNKDFKENDGTYYCENLGLGCLPDFYCKDFESRED